MRAGVTQSGIAYGVAGSGPPLLWLSGYVVTLAALERYVERFAERYTCIVFDARGSGRTPASVLPRTTAAMALDAAEVLRECGHDSAHVHGISLGGMVAQEFAIRAPHRVRALVLGSTTAGGFTATPSSPLTMWSSLYGARASLPSMGRVSWRGAFNQAWAASRHDASSRLGRVTAPTLVMHGTRDALLPVANAETLVGQLPHAELRLLQGVGHFYPIEAPAASAEVVFRWLDQQGDIPPGPRPGAADLLQDLATAPLRAVQGQVLPWRHAYRSLRPR